ncbi:MAG: hypothetical protein M9894_09170 [Planctomycetes bacterium]|nr:hypothetical protein [Planctomycetota bacterium]
MKVDPPLLTRHVFRRALVRSAAPSLAALTDTLREVEGDWRLAERLRVHEEPS